MEHGRTVLERRQLDPEKEDDEDTSHKVLEFERLQRANEPRGGGQPKRRGPVGRRVN